MKITNFKTNNIILNKTLKNTGVVLGTIAAMLGTNITVNPTRVEASSYTSSYNSVMTYFTETQANNIERYLNKGLSKTNLEQILSYYQSLYRFINSNTSVRSTYYRDLDYYEQEELMNLLNEWESDIYYEYKDTSYFRNTCKSELGFYLSDNNTNGYYYEHRDLMETYTETLRDEMDEYLNNRNSSNLSKALKVYKKYVNFITGNVQSNKYYFSDLTNEEQNTLYNILRDLTWSLESEYSSYSNYESECRSVVGWIVNSNNLERKLGVNLDNNSYIPNEVYPDTYYPNTYYPNNSYPNVTYPNNYNVNVNTNSHNDVMNYYIITLPNTFNTYMPKHTLNNLTSAFRIFKQYVDFIEGKVSGLAFNNLTAAEQNTIYNIVCNMTKSLEAYYGGYQFYCQVSINIVGWVVNNDNVYAELNQYITPMPAESYQNNNPQIPNNYSVPNYSAPSYPQVPNNYTEPSVNNTPNINWHDAYIDPSIDTSNGDYYNYAPEYIDENNNYNYNDYVEGYYGDDYYDDNYGLEAPEYVYIP